MARKFESAAGTGERESTWKTCGAVEAAAATSPLPQPPLRAPVICDDSAEPEKSASSRACADEQNRITRGESKKSEIQVTGPREGFLGRCTGTRRY